MDTLSQRIRHARLNRDLSQHQLAQLTGVSQPTVANWESAGHSPRQSMLNKISIALGVELSWLVAGADQSHENVVKTYLKSPIQHVPIYKDGLTADTQTYTDCIGYVPFSSHHADLYAVLFETDDETADLIKIYSVQSKPHGKPGPDAAICLAEIKLYKYQDL